MMISENIIKEADILQISLLMGVVLVLVYDLLRVVRRIIPHGKWWIAVEDLLFWTGCAIAVFVMLFRENDGYLRGFSIGGIAIGMLLYSLILSRFVVKASVFLLEKILFILVRPLVWTIRLLKPIMRFLKKIGKKVIRFFKKQLKKMAKAVKMGLYKM
ncbi:spore cortex biosynthesis protein YabQ [Lachnospiraceae bacterium ZAX-1]